MGNNLFAVAVIAIILILAAAGAYVYLTKNNLDIIPPADMNENGTANGANAEEQAPQEPDVLTGPRVQIGSAEILVDIARTETERQKGLSGRPSLGADEGMLFLFPKPAIYNFWMPDMYFPIDIIWISSDRKIVDISADVPNDFDPKKPRYFRPSVPAQYVLEVNAGFAAAHGIRKGDEAVFTEIQL